MIDSLPGEESTAELQAAGLQQLEQDSELAGEQLRATVRPRHIVIYRDIS